MRHEQQAYWEMSFKAEYYTWCALRDHALPGGDPITGQNRDRWNRRVQWLAGGAHTGESREAYKAMARYWIKEAAAYRKKFTSLTAPRRRTQRIK